MQRIIFLVIAGLLSVVWADGYAAEYQEQYEEESMVTEGASAGGSSSAKLAAAQQKKEGSQQRREKSTRVKRQEGRNSAGKTRKASSKRSKSTEAKKAQGKGAKKSNKESNKENIPICRPVKRKDSTTLPKARKISKKERKAKQEKMEVVCVPCFEHRVELPQKKCDEDVCERAQQCLERAEREMAERSTDNECCNPGPEKVVAFDEKTKACFENQV